MTKRPHMRKSRRVPLRISLRPYHLNNAWECIILVQRGRIYCEACRLRSLWENGGWGRLQRKAVFGAHCYRLMIIITIATNWLPSSLSSWVSLLQIDQMIILTLYLHFLSIIDALLQFQAKNKIRVKNWIFILILILMTSTCFCARCRKFLGPVFLVFVCSSFQCSCPWPTCRCWKLAILYTNYW